MRSYTVTKFEGENLGPIDWSYDFRSHGAYGCMCSPESVKDECCETHKSLLKQAEELFRSGKRVSVRISDWWHDLYDVGMYDGWPYWKPTPAICTSTPLGGSEWHFFYDLREVKELTPKQSEEK